MSCSTTISECLPLSVKNSSAVRAVSSSVMPATTYAGRDAASSPAVGLLVLHRQQLATLLHNAFTL